jgi:hypothetical protein
MTLRIVDQTTEHGVSLALHGWLSAREVPTLEASAAAAACPVLIDLSQLAGADADGLRALCRVRARGGCLVGASPYIELLLETTEQYGNEGGGHESGSSR